MAVYVDDAFVHSTGWGKWQGGGHMMADTDDELHSFAAQLGLKRRWAQLYPERPWKNHYDLTRSKRDMALRFGATPEDAAGFMGRMQARRGLAP
jgi:hypothetical protein